MTKNIKLNVEFTEAALEKLLGSDLEEFQGLSAMKKARLVSEHIHARLGVDRPRTAAERRAIQNRIQELSDLGIDVTALLAQLDSDGDEDEEETEDTEESEAAETEAAPAVEDTEVAPATDAENDKETETEAEEATQETAGQVEETEQTEQTVAETPAAKVEAQTQATITEEPTVLPPADLGHGMPLIDEDDDGVTVTFS